MNIVLTKTGNLFEKEFSKNIYRQEIARMFKIVRFPSKLKSFFDSLQDQFHFNHFEYFQMLVLLIIFSWRRRNITALYRHLDNRSQPHRSRFNNFLNVGRCNHNVALQLKADELLNSLNPRKGDVIEFVIDDSKKLKTGQVNAGCCMDSWPTYRPKLSASQMIRTYDDRWSIEVFFKDSKQLLGLGQYQNVSYEAAVTHLHLVCFAYALLTHVAITRESAQGKQKSTGRLSTAGLQNEVRRIVWDDLTEYLKQFSGGNQIIKELERLLIAA